MYGAEWRCWALPVIARSAATWQSRDTEPSHALDCRASLAMTVLGWMYGAEWRCWALPRHCEERSDVAIHGHRAIARTGLPRFARNDGAGVDVRCGVALLGSPRHCEERSDVAIHGHRAIARTGLPRFARNDAVGRGCTVRSGVAGLSPVIARSAATWQSMGTEPPHALDCRASLAMTVGVDVRWGRASEAQCCRRKVSDGSSPNSLR